MKDGACSLHEGNEKAYKILIENLKWREHLLEVGVDGKINYDGAQGNRVGGRGLHFNWLIIQSRGRLLWTQ